MRRRVAVTGLGVVSPIGIGIDAFWDSLLQGVSGIREITRFDTTGCLYNRGGEIQNFAFPDGLAAGAARPDRATQFLLTATAEALADAGLAAGAGDAADTGVALATNFGAVGAVESLLAPGPEAGAQMGAPDGAREGASPDLLASPDPFRFLEYGFQGGADAVGERWGLRGPRAVLSLSCSSSTAALGYAAGLIRVGRARRVVTAGYDALSAFCWSGLSALRTMTKDAVRPFDRNRAGTIFSEGAGALILEDLELALARKAHVYAEVMGYGVNNNAHHMTAPDADGAGSAGVMRMALEDAGLDAGRVDHVNTHGTGTKYNDSSETTAIKAVLGEQARRTPITANKSSLGHMMGAAGSVEAIASILTIRDGVIPPTMNYQEPDPECDLDCVPNRRRRADVRTVISNSAGIGGCNAAVVLGRVDP